MTMRLWYDIISLLEFTLSNNYFIYNDVTYKQIHGCAMGSPVSPVVANICMDNKISFLDTPITQQGNDLKIDVFRKPSHTDRYLDFKAPSTRTRVNIFTCEYFHGFKNYRIHTLPFSYRFRLSTRTRVNLKTMIKYIRHMRRRRDEPAKTCT